MTPGPCAVCLLTLILLLSGCTPGGGLTSLPFGKCKLPNGAQSYGYVFNNDGNIGACFSTPKTIAVTSLVTFNLPPDTVKLWNDDGTSFTLSGVIQPQDFSMAAAGPVYMLDNSPSNQRIALIDPQTGKITAQIPLPQAGYSNSAIAVSPDGKFLYVTKGKAELSVATAPSSVVVVNLATNKVDTEIVLPATVAPQGGIAITPDGQFAYVPVSISIPGTPVTYSIYVLDIAARKVSTIIPFPDSAIPVHTAVTPDGTSVYVARQTSVLAIDVLTNSIAANIVFPVPMALNRIVMDPAGRYLYATNQGPQHRDRRCHHQSLRRPDQGGSQCFRNHQPANQRGRTPALQHRSGRSIREPDRHRQPNGSEPHACHHLSGRPAWLEPIRRPALQ